MAKRPFRLTPVHKQIIYLLLAFVVIMIFRMIIPGGIQPISPFAVKWRLFRGILTIADWFPALALSAFIVPFGYRNKDIEDKVFVPGDLASLTSSVIRAIVASCLYGLILFFVVPLVADATDNMQSQTVLYNKSRAEIRSLLFRGGVLAPGALTDTELSHARQFLAVCEYIWPEGNGISAERDEIRAEVDQRKIPQNNRNDRPETGEQSPVRRSFDGQRQPVDASEALRFASEAMDGKRYYDAHWLATLAGRLAPDGSIEQNAAARLASQAWETLEQFQPSEADIRAHDNYRTKREGYEAMTAEDWIRAYYIFLELRLLTPNDPDLAKFIAKSEEGLRSVAFFADEVAMTSPLLKTDAVFSVPRIESGGRTVIRAASISVFSDVAYALNTEILGFDALRRPVYIITAPYAKIVPVTIGDRARSVIYMRALDRQNKDLRWEPEWEELREGITSDGSAELVIDMAYEDIIIACESEIADTNYRFTSLHAAGDRLADYGFVPEAFSVLEIRSISEPLMLLPLSVLAIIIGWRYRVKDRRARYVLVPMLIVLPIVFNTLVHLCRHLTNLLAIWAVLSVSLTAAIAISVGLTAGLFIIAIIGLAYQKESK
ncbi:MAG: hypothetical protein LBK61_07310 [Spirochaetaceae bacterium]|jgi:hypothetical protein|nr:hypothetical protein [Spirochaetaceae bacterium]